MNLLGDEFKLYLDSADSFDTPTWVEQTDVGDLGHDVGRVLVEIPNRGNDKKYRKGRRDKTITGSLSYDPSNASHVTIIEAIESNTAELHLAIADGPIATAGTNYWHGWFVLTGPTNAGLDAPATIDFEAKVSALTQGNTDGPAKVTVAA